jgi:hypothetical protein
MHVLIDIRPRHYEEMVTPLTTNLVAHIEGEAGVYGQTFAFGSRGFWAPSTCKRRVKMNQMAQNGES